MIVKNEEKVLKRCLDSIKDVVDEMIVVDTGSTDKTVEIAAQAGALVHSFKWIDDFAAARNYSFSLASSDYCMWLDADDVITAENKEKLMALKKRLSSDIDVVMLKYNTSFDAQGRPTFSFFRERILKNSPNLRWKGRVHEAISPYGKVIHEEICIDHRKIGAGDSGRNLRIYEKMREAGEVFVPRDQFYYGRELYYHQQYSRAADVLTAFLAEQEAWLENKVEAALVLADCYEALGKFKEEKNVLITTFLWDLPRGEILCRLGDAWMREKKYEQAVFWYQQALGLTPKAQAGGFVRQDCYDFTPSIQLCICLDRLGRKKEAYAYHQKAKAAKPDNAAVLYNETYFHRLGFSD